MLAPWRLGKMLLRRLGSKRAVPRAGGGAPPPGHPSTDTLGGAHLARPGDDAGDDGSSDEEAVGRAARASRARREAARTAAGGGGVDASLGSTLRSFASPRSTAEQRVETPLGVPALDLEPLQRQPQGGAGASAGEGKPSKLGGAAAAGRTPAQKQFLRRYTGSDKGVAGEGGAPCGRLQPLGSLVGSRGGIARRRLSSGSSTRREVTDDEGGDSEARGGTDRADEAGTSGSSPSDTESASHDGLEKAAEGGGESGPPRSSATASTWGRESPVGFWLEDSAAANARGPRVAPAADPCIPPYALTATWRVAVRQQPAVVGIARWWLRAARASAQAPPAHGNGLARAIGRHAWQQAQQQRVGEPGPVAVARTGLSRSRAWGGAMGGGEAESARSSLSREASDAAEGEDEEDGEEEEEAWGGAGVQRGTSWSSAEPPGWQSQREPQGVERVGGFAIVRVVAALEAESEGELSLAEGMRLAVVEKDASGWWLGRVVGVPLTGEGGSGSTASMAATATEAPPGAPSLLREGWFPCTYAEWCMPGEASNRSWVSIASARDLAHIPRQDRLVESAVPEEDAEDLDAGSVSPH